ncbi:MAG: hypothetical protein J6W82_05375 [Bacteroidales bacterium]|nr:hypothetical protein [Bacteroidales bacterium]
MFKAERLYKRKSTGKVVLDSVKARHNELRDRKYDVPLLTRCEHLWLNDEPFRLQRARGIRFYAGDQWGDTIEVNGKTMTYRQYLSSTGNVVIQTNQVKNRIDTIAGLVVKERQEPVCHAIDRDEQQYGEVVTVAVQANCDKNVFSSLENKWIKELCYGGWAVAYESYDDHSGPYRRLDSWTKYINPGTVFYDNAATDPRGWDLSLVGRYYYGSFEEIAAQFARSKEDLAELKKHYAAQSVIFREEASGSEEEKHANDELVFMRSDDPTRCYVCEVWTKETRARIRLYDTNDTTPEEIIDENDYAYRAVIRKENERRRAACLAKGWAEEDIPYIVGDGYGKGEERNGFFMDTFWYCKFISPDGYVLWEGESPYADRSHPFTFCIFPGVDGKKVGYSSDAIDHNIAMNRAVILHEWLVRAQAKGVTVVPKSIVPDNVSFKEFARSWTAIDDLVFVDLDESKKDLFPKTFFGAAQNFDVGALIRTYQQLMDSGSPVNGALQGKAPSSGTSGTLYAQMATNASTPIAALLDEFYKFIQNVLVKKMKNIVMFYSPERLESIAGQIDGILDASSLRLNEVKDIEYDLKIKQSADTPVFRAVINQDAKEFLLNGFISFEEYLEIADVPYADKILQRRQARQAEAEQAAEQQPIASPKSVQQEAIQQEVRPSMQPVGQIGQQAKPII